MKLIKPSFEIIEQQPGILGLCKQIELAGRTCYKSEDKITETSAKGFVDRMIKSGHGAMLEHGTVYLMAEGKDTQLLSKYQNNKYSEFCYNIYDGYESQVPVVYVTTNYRVLIENDWLNDLEYLCEPTKYHEKRITVRFTCDRGVSHEYVRHRVFSFAQESTRYCNYSKDKFGNEVTFIMPCWIPYKDGEYRIGEYEDGWGNSAGDYIKRNGNYIEEDDPDYKNLLYPFIKSLNESENNYFRLLNKGWKPQEARAVLPNSLKTELVMTGFVSDWQHFFSLRCDSAAHPQARELAIPLKNEFINRGLINES